jgi:hypothetical protein
MLRRCDVESLSSHGFVRIPVVGDRERRCIDSVLEHIHSFSSFRFPPIEEDVAYTDEIRIAFRLFFQVGVDVLRSLVESLSPTEDVLRLQDEIAHTDLNMLFTYPDDPFVHASSFSGSFFNLFHYDYGCLNTHRDRYLVTVIAASPPKTLNQHSVLWVRSPKTGEWQCVDSLVEQNSWIIFIGEELAHISTEAGFLLPAAEHCIRCDPMGEYISHSHHKPDPATLLEGNRRSIALVLGSKNG